MDYLKIFVNFIVGFMLKVYVLEFMGLLFKVLYNLMIMRVELGYVFDNVGYVKGWMFIKCFWIGYWCLFCFFLFFYL